MKQDPIERALDAYFGLDTDQRATFAMAVKHVERFAAQLGHSVDYCKPQDETKPRRGRPVGSKNRRAVNPLAPETFDATALFSRNAANAEGL